MDKLNLDEKRHICQSSPLLLSSKYLTTICQITTQFRKLVLVYCHQRVNCTL